MASKLPTVAIIGRANAGKSSLFNRLVKSRQAIVAKEAGTTRDNVLGKVTYNDHQFWLVDTAGLKDPNDEFEASIQDQINEAAEAADAILVVTDSTEYVGDEDRIGFVLVDWEEVDMLQGLCACIRSQDHRRQIGHLSQNITTPLDDFFNVQLTIKEDFL